ncbi:MAG: D-alanyl-D-alanine carboxypeptidase/D-alanyl-D-alanine-endopeptidase, partial [Abditibacteriales bacterium]|nr:D-alanyl-D-alanine carboxypeptidase/D-alanyl-D-alanine-endopeptidase [Abditibacteriales bacterium]MDW8368449.1 D-alanyl-D-alanine carboxypeptidase/D-alanyl-D-alanine-endopeptidase [Abditibacteriales bacterium]
MSNKSNANGKTTELTAGGLKPLFRFLLFIFLCACPVSPHTYAARKTPEAKHQTLHTSLRRAIAAALNTTDFKHALVGCLIVRARDRRLIFEQNADTLLMPASNMKLLTAATALDVLGGDFRCRTTVRAQMAIAADGTLASDLFLVGSGDPTLTYEDLKKLAQSLWDRGVRKVEGCVVGDESAFQGAPLGFGWQWDDLPWYYSMEVSALSLGRNQVNVVVKPGEKVGGAAVVTVEPANGYVVVENAATTGDEKARNTIAFDRELGGKCIKVRGVIPLGAPPSSQRCSVWQPCLYTATVFAEMLKAQGIEVRGSP